MSLLSVVTAAQSVCSVSNGLSFERGKLSVVSRMNVNAGDVDVLTLIGDSLCGNRYEKFLFLFLILFKCFYCSNFIAHFLCNLIIVTFIVFSLIHKNRIPFKQIF